jgi:hypothetical protein
VQVNALPQSVEHLLLVSAVPVVYPEVTAMEDFMKGIQNKNSIAVKTGMRAVLSSRAVCFWFVVLHLSTMSDG